MDFSFVIKRLDHLQGLLARWPIFEKSSRRLGLHNFLRVVTTLPAFFRTKKSDPEGSPFIQART
jgi:hypothetical protein